MTKPPHSGQDFSEEMVSSRIAYEGALLKVRLDEVRLHDGSPARREYVEHPGAVVMLAFLDPATILLERQFRYPKRRHFIELPAGKLNPGEPPLETARRELVEECGFEAGEWWKIATLDPCIGYSDEVIHLYGARGLVHVGAQLDAGEHLEVFEAKLADALEWVRDGAITDTKTSLGLLWWAQFGAGAVSKGLVG
ncbi:MAG TPA: NUDIX hydrolase [Usitatibacter sp.]|nr:NUDIX hydrolase [Usitatibacter sp.]